MTLLERLEAMKDSGLRTIGGGSIGYQSDGTVKTEMWGNEPIMVRANPDGPEAAARIRELEETVADHERWEEMVSAVSLGLDKIDAIGEQWIAAMGQQQLIQAICSVFTKYSNDDIMQRFREKLVAMLHLAFVEGACIGHAGTKDAHAEAEAELKIAQVRIRELEAALREMLPGKLCGESWSLPDTETVSIVTTFGKLAKCRALLCDGDGEERA